MTEQPEYYYPNKPRATEVADELMRTDDRVEYCEVQFEPDNGWVVVAVPKVLDITDLGKRFEVRHPNGARLTNRPSHYKRVALPQASARQPRATPTGPAQPGTPAPPQAYKAHPAWGSIATAHAAGKSRDEIVAMLVKEGYDSRTSGRQYRHWLKSQGLWAK